MVSSLVLVVFPIWLVTLSIISCGYLHIISGEISVPLLIFNPIILCFVGVILGCKFSIYSGF